MKLLWIKIRRFFPFFVLVLLALGDYCYANDTIETFDQDITVSLCLVIVALVLWRNP